MVLMDVDCTSGQSCVSTAAVRRRPTPVANRARFASHAEASIPRAPVPDPMLQGMPQEEFDLFSQQSEQRHLISADPSMPSLEYG